MPFATCHHIKKEDGDYCASPALRDRKFCYHHLIQRGRRLRRALAQSRSEPCQPIIPPLEGLGSIRVALSEIVQALAARQLDHRSAGLMLYAIQQATTVSLRIDQMQATMEDADDKAVVDDSPRLAEYPEFEREFGIKSGIDLDAETDHAMRMAEDQAAALSIAPTPGAGCPVSANSQYTREEAYQVLQWQIHRMRQQIREHEERRQEEREKPVASTNSPLPLSSTA